MAKMMGPRFKLCRRLGLNVCGHPKAMERAFDHNSRYKRNMSDYGQQLLEKQRLRAYYGVMERQFIRYVKKAMKSKEITGDALVKSLECRLDNIVYRMGFANSIRQARQMVNHGHITVNGASVDIPSYAVKSNDVISLREKSKKIPNFKSIFEENRVLDLKYISKDLDNYSGVLLRYPEREEIPIQINDQLVVEFYSRK